MNIFIFSLIFPQILTILCQESTTVPAVTEAINSETFSDVESFTTMGPVSFVENTTMEDIHNSTIENETTIDSDNAQLSLNNPISKSNSSESIELPKSVDDVLPKLEAEAYSTTIKSDAIETPKLTRTGEINKIEDELKQNETEKIDTDIEKTIEVEKLNETLDKQNETVEAGVKLNKNAILDDIPPTVTPNAEIRKEDEMQNDEPAVDATNDVHEAQSSSTATSVQDVKSSTENVVSLSTAASIADKSTTMESTSKESTTIEPEITSILLTKISKTTESSVIYRISNGPSQTTTIHPQHYSGNNTKNSANTIEISSSLVTVLLLLSNVYYIGKYF